MTSKGGKVPSLFSDRLKSFLDQKKKNERDISTIRIDRDIGIDDVESSARPHKIKRKKLDSEKSIEILFTTDVQMGSGGGKKVIGTRILCMGRTRKLLGAKERKELEKIPNLERSLKEIYVIIVDVTTKMKSKEEEVLRLQGQICDLQNQI
ncbi:uncharacterized protein LOC127748332 [Arachis duranensis]|uniref:Uncharacterized protein LOC127748332 n=1 Tax=Arachis duranensis TaxID=130453 RepID=A0A9C6TLI5_ARADU|nr:uncharacterized protein LOC127748332 [Arachis duranensis]